MGAVKIGLYLWVESRGKQQNYSSPPHSAHLKLKLQQAGVLQYIFQIRCINTHNDQGRPSILSYHVKNSKKQCSAFFLQFSMILLHKLDRSVGQKFFFRHKVPEQTLLILTLNFLFYSQGGEKESLDSLDSFSRKINK